MVSEAFLAMRDALHELQEMGVILRDLDRGLADFPSLRDGREIYLCWEEGEDEVRYWHEPDAGFDGRRPLSTTMPEAGRLAGDAAGSLVETWRRLNTEQRVAAVGAVLLIVSTFGPFSFVEAAIVLTGLSVLYLLRARADRREFHLPSGDGTVILAAGLWAALLIVVRLFDRPFGLSVLALACAAILAARRPARAHQAPRRRRAAAAASARRALRRGHGAHPPRRGRHRATAGRAGAFAGSGLGVQRARGRALGAGRRILAGDRSGIGPRAAAVSDGRSRW